MEVDHVAAAVVGGQVRRQVACRGPSWYWRRAPTAGFLKPRGDRPEEGPDEFFKFQIRVGAEVQLKGVERH